MSITFILDSFKMIRVSLERQLDIKHFLNNIFKTCNLPTENIEKIQVTKKSSTRRFSSDAYEQYQEAPIYDEYEIYARTMRTKQAKTLRYGL